MQQDGSSPASKRLSTASSVGTDGDAGVIAGPPQQQQQRSSQQQQHRHRPAFERFLVVKPPPHHLRHPMNLQVQLLNTASTAGSNQQSSSSHSRGPSHSHGHGHIHRADSRSSGSGGDNNDDPFYPGRHRSDDRHHHHHHNRSDTNVSFSAVAEASVANGDSGAFAPSSIPATPSSAFPGDAGGAGVPASANTNNLCGDRTSGDGANSLTSGALSRTSSIRSNRSTTSLASSTGSSSMSMTRKVLPCYNLEFHSLQPSVVTDAGTEAKVAKIHKRGVEILDFAILDPVFLSQAAQIPSFSKRDEARRAAERSKPASSSSSFAQDFKPSNLLNKFKRLSFRGGNNNNNNPTGNSQPASSASANNNQQSATPPGKPFHRFTQSLSSDRLTVLSLSKGPGSGLASSSSPASGGSRDATANTLSGIPVVPLFRERSSEPTSDGSGLNSNTQSPMERRTAARSSFEASAASAGGTTTPTKSRHASGYVWIVRQYLRKDLEEKAVAEIAFEWRKKRRRGSSNNRLEDSKTTPIATKTLIVPASSTSVPPSPNPAGPQSTAAALMQPLVRSNTPDSMAASRNVRRHSVQIEGTPRSTFQTPISNDTASTIGVGSSSSGVRGATPLRSFGTPTMHLQKPSDETLPSRNAQSFDISRTDISAHGRLVSAPGSASSLHRTSSRTSGRLPTESPSPSSSRAADLLNPNRIFKTRTQGSNWSTNSASGHGHSNGGSSVAGDGSHDGQHGHGDESTLGTATPTNPDNRPAVSSHDEVDEGEESDPEDSEQPWICELVIKRPSTTETAAAPATIRNSSSSAAITGGGGPTTPRSSFNATNKTQRILLGTVTPAPHHPKLVAQLAIPLNLHPVCISFSSSSDGPKHASSSSSSALYLSVEELKDITTVTGLWLIVREALGLGGINKKSAGGDWRLAVPAALKRD